MGDVKLYRAASLISVGEPVYPEMRAFERLDCSLSVVGEGEHQEVGVPETHQTSAGPEDPRCLRYPAIRIAPDNRAVFAQGQVERVVAERGSLRITVHQREQDSELPLKHRRAG